VSEHIEIRYLTQAEAAALLGVSTRTLRRWSEAGRRSARDVGPGPGRWRSDPGAGDPTAWSRGRRPSTRAWAS